MLKNIMIIGAGGVGRETALIINDINNVKKEWNVLGFIDDNQYILNDSINGYKVLGNLEFLRSYKEEVYVICAISDYKIKKMIISELKNNINIKFATLIHPSTKLDDTVNVGEGCIIYQNVITTTNIEIGNHVIISPKCGIGHDTKIKDYCSILWNVNLSGNVKIEEGNLVGSASTIIQGITVGKESVVGAGTVVIRDVPSKVTVVGNPARVINKKKNLMLLEA